MTNTLVIWILLATCLNAESVPNTALRTATSDDVTTSSPSQFNFDEQLSKINNSFLPCHEYKQLAGDLVSGDVADDYNLHLLESAHRAIGLSELRAVLGFHQPVEWTVEYIHSDEVLKDDLTIEKYYEKMESRYCRYRMFTFFFESQLLSGMDFMDKHLPAVRNVYRRKFEEKRRIPRTKLIVDREEVDRMLENYIDIKDQMEDAIRGVLRNQKSCSSVDSKHEKKRKEDSEKVTGFHDF